MSNGGLYDYGTVVQIVDVAAPLLTEPETVTIPSYDFMTLSGRRVPPEFSQAPLRTIGIHGSGTVISTVFV